MTTTKRIRL